MSSLRGLIGECWEELTNGVAWVALYKDGRSWQTEAFYPESGDFEDGYVLSEEDYREIARIGGIDHKAICVNGYHMRLGEDFTLKELENKILYFYENRLHQLQGDFVGGLVVPQRTYDLYENKGLTAAQMREEYRGLTGLDNDDELTDDEVYRYMLEALWEKGDQSVEELISDAAQRSCAQQGGSEMEVGERDYYG